MMFKSLTILVILFMCFNVKAQSVEEYQKAQDAVMAGIQDTELKTFINTFSSALVHYDWRTSRQFFDEDHYSIQMKIYLNDDFMFEYLGKVGKRDTAAVHSLYMRETLGLTVDEQEKWIKEPSIINLFKLEDFTSITQVYFTDKKLLQLGTPDLLYYAFKLVVMTEDGKTYLGKCWIDSQNIKIFGGLG